MYINQANLINLRQQVLAPAYSSAEQLLLKKHSPNDIPLGFFHAVDSFYSVCSHLDQVIQKGAKAQLDDFMPVVKSCYDFQYLLSVLYDKFGYSREKPFVDSFKQLAKSAEALSNFVVAVGKTCSELEAKLIKSVIRELNNKAWKDRKSQLFPSGIAIFAGMIRAESGPMEFTVEIIDKKDPQELTDDEVRFKDIAYFMTAITADKLAALYQKLKMPRLSSWDIVLTYNGSAEPTYAVLEKMLALVGNKLFQQTVGEILTIYKRSVQYKFPDAKQKPQLPISLHLHIVDRNLDKAMKLN